MISYMESKKNFLSSYLFLASGIQLLLSLYYDFDISKGKIERFEKLFGNGYSLSIFKYSVLSFFLNGLLYHCLSKSLKRGNSGFSIQYVFVLININQLLSILFFLMSNVSSSQFTFFVFFQLILYSTTFVLGSFLNYYCFSDHHNDPFNHLLNTNTQFKSPLYMIHMSKRRDWGIASTLFSAIQLVLLFWSFVRYTFYDRDVGIQKYGEYLNLFSISTFLINLGSFGIHIFSLKVSKGCHCNCTSVNSLYVYFMISELIGMIIYIYISIMAKRAKIFYYHVLIVGLGMLISSYGNYEISKKKYLDVIANYESSLNNHENETQRKETDNFQNVF